MKVGLVTVYNGYNYGSKLQAFALQNVLQKKLGVDVEIIAYNRSKDYRPWTVFRKIVRKIERHIEKDTKRTNNPYAGSVSIRKKAFDEFDINYNLTTPISGYNNLKKIVPNFDLFICGSDQVWSPDLIVTDFYTLYFVGKLKKTIAYAASFGIDKIPFAKRKSYKAFLNKIDYISVREKNGCELVKQLTGKDATWVLDPTLILDYNEWRALVSEKNSVFPVEKKYIFCYFLGENQSHRDFAEKLSKKTGYDIISLPYIRGYNKADEEMNGEKLYNINPLQFVSLIANAEYICTDSFHGTVFSIIFEKQFFTLKRYSDQNKVSTNSRITSLLNMVGLSNRLVTSNIDIEQIKEISKDDYSTVCLKLEEERRHSLDFLELAINE